MPLSSSSPSLNAQRWNALRWHAERGLRGVGLPGWAALVLMVGSAVVALGGVAPLHAEADRLGADSALLEQRLAVQAQSPAVRVITPQQQLAEFVGRFPNEQGMAPALARLQALARQRGVALDEAEFKFVSDAAEPLARYSITLPLKADYRSLRRTTRDALRELPGLAMEEVNLRRSDPGSPLLDAQLRFVLFVTKPKAVPTSPPNRAPRS